jgi:hypothetical protein
MKAKSISLRGPSGNKNKAGTGCNPEELAAFDQAAQRQLEIHPALTNI